MLKLTYHNTVFGPIDFEYDRPVLRVGRSEDNDLVLRHPSVEPHHCILVFRDTKVLCLRPNQALSAETDLRSVTGPEFGIGDQLQIGELLFNLGRSARTVAIPSLPPPSVNAPEAPGPDTYFCPNCRVSYRSAELKHVGLVGHAKRSLCPRCSYVFEVESQPPTPAPTQKHWFRRSGTSRA